MVGILLHGSRSPPAVHEHHGRTGPRGDCSHGGILLQSANVVDDIRPGRQGSLRHLGLNCIDGNKRGALAAQPLDDGNDSAALLGDANRLCGSV